MRTIRALLTIVVLVAAGAIAYAYLTGWRVHLDRSSRPSESVGTAGSLERARESGAEIGEKAAVTAKKVGETVEEAALTTKIKAKMALDDDVKASAINVTTNGGVVTLEGTVRSKAERDRAISLARETSGVSRVVDRLEIHPIR